MAVIRFLMVSWVLQLSLLLVLLLVLGACAPPQTTVTGFEFDLVRLMFEEGVR